MNACVASTIVISDESFTVSHSQQDVLMNSQRPRLLRIYCDK